MNNNDLEKEAVLSHELKTPLAVILAECEHSLNKDLSRDDIISSLLSIKGQAEKMNSIINQLLFISRCEAGKACTEDESFDFSELCEIIIDNMLPLAKESEVRLLTRCDKNLNVFADKTMITRLITNLVSNGIKYNKRGGFVEVRASECGGTLCIEVVDSGIGIAQNEVSKIWGRFYQVSPSVEKGCGLGLAIVKLIVDYYNGNVEADSRIDEGSHFIVKLPILL